MVSKDGADLKVLDGGDKYIEPEGRPVVICDGGIQRTIDWMEENKGEVEGLVLFIMKKNRNYLLRTAGEFGRTSTVGALECMKEHIFAIWRDGETLENPSG